MIFFAFAALAAAARPAAAVILYKSSTRNIAAPDGNDLKNSGWQWEGKFAGFLGTAIGAHFFITAEHIGGKVGDYFSYNGTNYKTIASYNDPQSDLQIWQVHGKLHTTAPLYTGNNEVGQTTVIYGRGTQRGATIYADGQAKGWKWGAADSVQSWGDNLISGFSNSQSDASAGNKSVRNGRLVWTFDRHGKKDEGTLSDGDSGGGDFIRVNGKWQLAGINFSTEAEYSITGSGAVLSGALFDQGGLYSNGKLIPDTSADDPAASFATRISSRIKWIDQVLAGKGTPGLPDVSSGVPEPGMLGFFAIASLGWLLKRPRGKRITPRTSTVHD